MYRFTVSDVKTTITCDEGIYGGVVGEGGEEGRR